MKEAEHQVCLLVGSNIQPERNLRLGLDLLKHQVTLLRTSSVWETASVGSGGPDFLNLAVLVTTLLEAQQLKDGVLHPLEAQLGRARSRDKNAPRTIDFDIILFDGRQLDPNLFRYAHRAVPVSQLLPDYRSGQGETLAEAAARLAKETFIRLRPDVQINMSLKTA
jgi:2-amino-4-hydroxy-6-hydroxymethyldihydropteridine diphosphokinase